MELKKDFHDIYSNNEMERESVGDGDGEQMLGYASLHQGGSSELVDGGSIEKRCSMKDGPSLYFVVYLEGAK
jgi:hypothetical protein